MGRVLKLLADATPIRLRGLWHKYVRIERCETMHVHWRNIRLAMTPQQFDIFAGTVRGAQSKWAAYLGTTNDVLLEQNELPGRAIDVDKIKVEKVARDLKAKANWPADHKPRFPYKIHVHYKDLRLEFEPDEFEQFAKVIAEASDS